MPKDVFTASALVPVTVSASDAGKLRTVFVAPANPAQGVRTPDNPGNFQNGEVKKSLTVLPAVFVALFCSTAMAGHGHEPISDGIENVPTLDAQMHYLESAWGPHPPETVIALMDRNSVAMALVSSTPDTGTIRLLEFAPDRSSPEQGRLGGGNGSGTRINADRTPD
ncbi:hypothetical protein [Hoeflea sp.]|uniref:hypothetical protein n=1 Tax=Hoeflea sp. TaxID=1940281 RepID=UPI003B020995